MTIGLLQCDHVADEFVGIAGDYDAMFQRWLPADWRVYDLPAGQFPALDPYDACDAWVTTGSHESVYDDVAWVHRFAELVRQIHAAGVPFLGVCFGHQMMGHALGGRVSKSERGWGIGVHEFEIRAREAWMSPPLDTVSVLMSCQDQVDVVPPGAVVLASNAHCPVAIFRCGSMLGIQGHPEWEPEYAAALLGRRRDRIGADCVDAALAGIMRPRNSGELSEWAKRWLTRIG